MTTDLAIIEKYGDIAKVKANPMSKDAALRMAIQMLDHIKNSGTYDSYEYLCRLEAIRYALNRTGTRHPEYITKRIAKLKMQLEQLKDRPAKELQSKKMALKRWKKILEEMTA